MSTPAFFRWNFHFPIHGLDRVTDSEADRFKSSLSRECPTYFIGMWDCVKVIGAFSRRRKNPRLPDKTAFGYHALAIDETRRFFKPLLWEDTAVQDQTLEQVWFPGVHGDISGGYAERGLSDIALQWMLDKANAASMLIDQQQYEGLRPDPLADMHDSRIGAFGLLPSWPRLIPKGAMLHPSVEQRVRQSDYSPGNIKNIVSNIQVRNSFHVSCICLNQTKQPLQSIDPIFRTIPINGGILANYNQW